MQQAASLFVSPCAGASTRHRDQHWRKASSDDCGAGREPTTGAGAGREQEEARVTYQEQLPSKTHAGPAGPCRVGGRMESAGTH
jgi:hypothetical protein